MPELTPRICIKKPLGNETVSRDTFNENWDIIDAAVVTREEISDTVEKVFDHDTRLQTVEAQLEDTQPLPVTMQRGMQVLNVEEDTPFNVLNVRGRTLINLLGRDGNCEDVSKLTSGGTLNVTAGLDSTNKTIGTNSVKVTLVATGTGDTIGRSFTVLQGKNYVLVGDVKSGNATSARITLPGVGGVATGTATDTTKFTTMYKKFTPVADTATYLDLSVTGSTGQYAYFDAIRIYEISAAEYAAIDSMTPEQIAAKYPYQEGVVPIQNPYAIRYGTNLLPYVDGWEQGTLASADGSNFAITTRVRTAGFIPVIANTAYTFSASSPYTVWVAEYDKNNTFVRATSAWVNVPYTFTTQANTAYVRFAVKRDDTTVLTASDIPDIKPMFNIGTQPLPFEPRNDDYLFIPAKLHGNATVQDSLIVRDGKVAGKLKWFEEVVLDGSFAFSFHTDQVGFKSVSFPVLSSYNGTIAAIKYDGKVLSWGIPQSASDRIYYDGTAHFISIPDTDTGFKEMMDVSSGDWWKAWFNGWKYTGDGVSVSSWVSVYDGSAAPTQALSYVTANKAPGWTVDKAYKLLYQRATPIEEAIQVEGGISLKAGANVLEIGTGLINREPVTPVLNNGSYYINVINTGVTDSPLKNRTDKILDIFRNGLKDSRWSLDYWAATTYGNKRAYTSPDKYDPTAAYAVTYTISDRHTFTVPLDTLTGEYRTNIGGVVAELSQDMADIATRVNVNENVVQAIMRGELKVSAVKKVITGQTLFSSTAGGTVATETIAGQNLYYVDVTIDAVGPKAVVSGNSNTYNTLVFAGGKFLSSTKVRLYTSVYGNTAVILTWTVTDYV